MQIPIVLFKQILHIVANTGARANRVRARNAVSLLAHTVLSRRRHGPVARGRPRGPARGAASGLRGPARPVSGSRRVARPCPWPPCARAPCAREAARLPAPGRARGGGPGRGGGELPPAGLAVARAGAQNQYRPIFNLVLCRTCRRPIQPRGPPQPVLDPAHAFAHARLGDQAGADVGDLASVHATTDGDIAVD